MTGLLISPAEVAVTRLIRAAMVDVTNPGSVIYFAKNPASGLVKIGRTGDIRRRMAELRTAIPDLVLLGHVSGGSAAESDLHHSFADERVAGEWFRPTPRLARHVALLLGVQP